jgi:hypothetical protein
MPSRWTAARLLWREKNWMRRDVLIKQHLALDDAYFHRAASLLRLGLVQALAANSLQG